MPRRFILLLLPAILLLAGCMRWGDDSSDADLKLSFKEVMHFDQPASVTNLKCSYYWVRDSYSKWLYFECDAATIAKIKNQGKGTSIEAVYWKGGGPGEDGSPNAPAWWKNARMSLGVVGCGIDVSIPKRNTDITHIWIDKNKVYAVRDLFD